MRPAHTEAPRRPFVVPVVVDQGELSDVTRFFSGGHPKIKKYRRRPLFHHFSVLDIPGLDVDVENV
jgi:hypothetical protein